MSRFGLKEEYIAAVNQIFEQFTEIEQAILYGSRAKGNFKPASDIDLCLIGENLTNTLVNKISWCLDDLLLPYTFDLSILKQISNPNLVEHINRVGIVFYNKQRLKNHEML